MDQEHKEVMEVKITSLFGTFCYIFILCLRVKAVDVDSGHGVGVKLVLKVKQLGENSLFRQLHFYNLTQYDQVRINDLG